MQPPALVRHGLSIGLSLALFTAMGSAHAQERVMPETGWPLSGPSGYGYMPDERRFVDPYADVQTYRGRQADDPRAGAYGAPYDDGFSPRDRPERRMYDAPAERPFYGRRPQAYPGQGYEDPYAGAYEDRYPGAPEKNPYSWEESRNPGTQSAWDYERRSGARDQGGDYRPYLRPGPGVGETDAYEAGRSFREPAWNRLEPYGNDRYPPASIRREGRYGRGADDGRYGGPGADHPAPYAYQDRRPTYPPDDYGGGWPVTPYSGAVPGYGLGRYPGLAPGYDAQYWNLPGIGDMRFPGGLGGLPFRFGLF